VDFKLVFELSLEQQINLRIYEQQIKHLSREELESSLKDLIRQMMIKDNAIRNLMKAGYE
jgi:Phycobilisome degradation protein nblA